MPLFGEVGDVGRPGGRIACNLSWTLHFQTRASGGLIRHQKHEPWMRDIQVLLQPRDQRHGYLDMILQARTELGHTEF